MRVHNPYNNNSNCNPSTSRGHGSSYNYKLDNHNKLQLYLQLDESNVDDNNSNPTSKLSRLVRCNRFSACTIRADLEKLS